MKEMRLTSFDTIIFGDKELLFDEFFKKLNDNLGDDYSVCYEEDTNRFKIVFDGVEYFLVLDKITMDNYKFGNYSRFTLDLKKIIDRIEQIQQESAIENEKIKLETEESERKAQEILDRKKIIEDAENGLLPNDEAKRIYLAYLQEEKKLSRRIKRYFINLGNDIVASKKRFIKDGAELFGILLGLTFCAAFGISIYIGLRCFNSFLGSFGSSLFNLVTKLTFNFEWSFNKELLNIYWFSLLPFGFYPLSFVGISIETIVRRFCRLRDLGKNKKLTNHKIKQLSEELKRGSIEDKTFDAFDRTLPEPIKEQTKSFKDPVLGYLGAISNRLQYINPTEREVLRAEVKRIAEKYKGRLEEYRKQELDESSQIVLSLDNNSYISIINDIIPEINALEHRINQIRNYDVEKEQFDDEYLQLMDAIDNSNAGDIVIGGVQSRARIKPEQQ